MTMTTTSAVDWNTRNTSALISIGTHSLSVSTHGVPRTYPSQPIVLIINGTAGTLARWPALIRALSPHYRIFAHERSGIGQSDPSPDPLPPPMDTISSNLHALLEATSLQPPYILLAHSWGGMLATHFASTFSNPKSAIEGLILLDAGAPDHSTATNTHVDFMTDPGSPWSHPVIYSMARNLDIQSILTPPRDLCALTDSEYDFLLNQSSPSSDLEVQALQASYLPFLHSQFCNRDPPLLSGIPIALIHAHAYVSFQSLYSIAIGAGNGSEDERSAFQKLLSTWRDDVLRSQKQFLSLTEKENTKQMFAKEGCGHDVMMVDVENCVEGVRWAVERSEEIKKMKTECET